ncbi:hypothetical protein L2E82_19219 [Cichorium intybus]|uniref:Uncharacterized protein n=1 Tax=Cichorium intybus TaxID=13427 RepID=A0ACB9FB28_CICIN|nr:hypothetical protein L2E82_19219 [Cichorium intybus]
MMTTIRDCNGSLEACVGSTAAECLVVEDEEQEFLMDTEEHRRILATTNSNSISYGGLQQGNPACGDNCAGEKYDVNGRKCKTYDQCRS